MIGCIAIRILQHHTWVNIDSLGHNVLETGWYYDTYTAVLMYFNIFNLHVLFSGDRKVYR